MSIPDRFYRIAKHKLGEVKDWFDKVDEEEEEDAREKRRANPREDARRELSDTLTPSGNSASGTGINSLRASSPSSVPVNPPRTPQDYARGGHPASRAGSGYSTSPGGSNGSGNNYSANSQPDPLDYHYKLLGLESGADFAAVQAAYNKLAARSDPSRFPAGSSDALAAQQIRQRLDTSFKTLRESLDTTAARFGLLEFDDEPKKREDNTKEDEKRTTEDNRRKIE